MRDMDAEPTAHIAWGADGRLSQKWIITARNGPYIEITEEWRPVPTEASRDEDTPPHHIGTLGE